MEKDLITQALQTIHLQNGKDLKEVTQYLNMKYRIDADILVLEDRLKKLIQEEKAVAWRFFLLAFFLAKDFTMFFI